MPAGRQSVRCFHVYFYVCFSNYISDVIKRCRFSFYPTGVATAMDMIFRISVLINSRCRAGNLQKAKMTIRLM